MQTLAKRAKVACPACDDNVGLLGPVQLQCGHVLCGGCAAAAAKATRPLCLVCFRATAATEAHEPLPELLLSAQPAVFHAELAAAAEAARTTASRLRANLCHATTEAERADAAEMLQAEEAAAGCLARAHEASALRRAALMTASKAIAAVADAETVRAGQLDAAARCPTAVPGFAKLAAATVPDVRVTLAHEDGRLVLLEDSRVVARLAAQGAAAPVHDLFWPEGEEDPRSGSASVEVAVAACGALAAALAAAAPRFPIDGEAEGALLAAVGRMLTWASSGRRTHDGRVAVAVCGALAALPQPVVPAEALRFIDAVLQTQRDDEAALEAALRACAALGCRNADGAEVAAVLALGSATAQLWEPAWRVLACASQLQDAPAAAAALCLTVEAFILQREAFYEEERAQCTKSPQAAGEFLSRLQAAALAICNVANVGGLAHTGAEASRLLLGAALRCTAACHEAVDQRTVVANVLASSLGHALAAVNAFLHGDPCDELVACAVEGDAFNVLLGAINCAMPACKPTPAWTVAIESLLSAVGGGRAPRAVFDPEVVGDFLAGTESMDSPPFLVVAACELIAVMAFASLQDAAAVLDVGAVAFALNAAESSLVAVAWAGCHALRALFRSGVNIADMTLYMAPLRLVTCLCAAMARLPDNARVCEEALLALATAARLVAPVAAEATLLNVDIQAVQTADRRWRHEGPVWVAACSVLRALKRTRWPEQLAEAVASACVRFQASPDALEPCLRACARMVKLQPTLLRVAAGAERTAMNSLAAHAEAPSVLVAACKLLRVCVTLHRDSGEDPSSLWRVATGATGCVLAVQIGERLLADGSATVATQVLRLLAALAKRRVHSTRSASVAGHLMDTFPRCAGVQRRACELLCLVSASGLDEPSRWCARLTAALQLGAPDVRVAACGVIGMMAPRDVVPALPCLVQALQRCLDEAEAATDVMAAALVAVEAGSRGARCFVTQRGHEVALEAMRLQHGCSSVAAFGMLLLAGVARHAPQGWAECAAVCVQRAVAAVANHAQDSAVRDAAAWLLQAAQSVSCEEAGPLRDALFPPPLPGTGQVSAA